MRWSPLIAVVALTAACSPTPKPNVVASGPRAETVPHATRAIEPAAADEKWPADRFGPRDVFELEWASDPQISPEGKRIVYVRNYMDIMHDRRRSDLWGIDADGGNHRPIASGDDGFSSPRWAPDRNRLLYVSSAAGKTQLFVRWMDTGQTTTVTRVTEAPGNIAWSPDGRFIAFTMRVPGKPRALASLPEKPEGARWADPPQVVDQLLYRRDGAGFLKDGYTHLFVVPAEGGTPRQLTEGEFHHDGLPSWTPDGAHVLISANRHPEWQYEPLASEVYEVSVADGVSRALTSRDGPDFHPVVSPDGEKIAYLGFDDRQQGYQVTRLYVMNRDGSASRPLTAGLDRDVMEPVWSSDSDGLFFATSDHGNGKISYVDLDGAVTPVAGDVGGTVIGRPYASGSFSLARTGRLAFTMTRPDHPADVAVVSRETPARPLTRLNADLLGHKRLAAVESIWFESSFDRRRVQGWVVTPPGFDPQEKYPLVLEIHGGPFADYGDRFSAEVQLFASAGYVVLYVNPRGSTSYGEEFGNLIHHNYPGQDYDDLMSAVDAVLARGYVDPERLYVTGGSGGGILTSWIVGKTSRFKAAVVAKPVINWYSFVLTSDFPNYFYKYWFPGYPWEHPEHYLQRSPLSLVGNVSTPTMLLTGESDHRTPMSESEQYYQALKLRKVDTVLVRVPGASHRIAARPSGLIGKVAYILAWFEKYAKGDPEAGGTGAAVEAN